MPVGNFYKESDKITQQRWIIAAKITLGGVLLILMASFLGPQRTQKEIEEIISKSPNLKRVDEFCTNLPKPAESKILFKNLSGNSFTTAISYRYRIPKKSKEVYEFYDKLFSEKGWKYTDGRYESADGKKYVNVHLTDAHHSDYSFYCAEISR